jgi:FHA domain-containing protein
VARLLIYRGGTLVREAELTGGTSRLGRDPENEIYLEDAGKGLSRRHAEIRFEGGNYILVDTQSENGVWVAGAQVPYVVLEPNVVITMGPFRVMLDTAAVGSAAPGSGMPGLDQALYHAQQAAAAREPVPRPRTSESTARAAPPGRFADHRLLLMGGVAVAIIGVTGVTATKLLRDGAGASKPNAANLEWKVAASALVQQGKCSDALAKYIDPQLKANPNDADALALKNTCAPAPPPVVPPPVDTALEASLKAAGDLIDAKDCASALKAITAILEKDPANARALELRTRAEGCSAAATTGTKPPVAPVEAQVAEKPPEQGGLKKVPGETQKEYDSRLRAMRDRFDAAVAQFEQSRYPQAAAAFDQIIRDAGSHYLDAAQRRDDARRRAKEEGAKFFDTGRQALERNDWNAALEAFRRAHEEDPSLPTDAEIDRITDAKRQAGQEACSNGDAQYLLKRNADAKVWYLKVLELLPQADECYQRAKERLAEIRH